MRHRLPILLPILLLLLAPATQAQDIERTVPANAGGTLELKLEVGGSVDLSSWDRPEVGIRVSRSGRDASLVEVNVDGGGDRVSIQSRSARPRIDATVSYRIQVPRKYSVSVELSGGDLSISGVEGSLSGQTMGGALVLNDLTGSLALQTMGGDISLSRSRVGGTVHTMGGKVTLSDVTGDIDATTMGGDITYRNVRGTVRQETRVRTMGGNITVGDAPGGADVHTMGGNIEVGEVGGYLKAETMGGNITAGSVRGWIEARTMGGDLNLRMVGTDADRHVEVSSMGGRIELTLPADLSMAIDVEITVQGKDSTAYRIDSDFPLTAGPGRVDEQSGGRRRLITATGTVAGGRNRVRVRTVNGDVVIRRAN